MTAAAISANKPPRKLKIGLPEHVLISLVLGVVAGLFLVRWSVGLR